MNGAEVVGCSCLVCHKALISVPGQQNEGIRKYLIIKDSLYDLLMPNVHKRWFPKQSYKMSKSFSGVKIMFVLPFSRRMLKDNNNYYYYWPHLPLTSMWNRILCKSLVGRLNSRKTLKITCQPKNAFLDFPSRVLYEMRKTTMMGWSLGKKLRGISTEVNGVLPWAVDAVTMGIISCQ